MAGPPEPNAELLDVHTCWERVRGQAFGRMAVSTDDGPMIYAVNAVVDHGTVVFRTAEGTKLDALRRDPRVAYEVDGVDVEHDRAWSVVVRGVARELDRIDDIAGIDALGVTPWQYGAKPTYVRIDTADISGVEFQRIPGVDSR